MRNETDELLPHRHGPPSALTRSRAMGRAPAPRALAAVAVLVVVQVILETVHVANRSDLRPALRGLILIAIALHVAFAWGALRLRPGAALGLMVSEATVLIAALTGDLGITVRLGLALSSVAALGLLGAASSGFPRATLPKP